MLLVYVMPAMLNALLGSETRAAVLGHLLLRPEVEIHLRELVRVTGFSPRSVNKEVDRLVAAEFLLERRSSNRRYLRANKRHQLFNDLRNIIDKTTGVVPALTAALGKEKGIRLALLFGSTAAGSEGPASDVDLLVVGSISLTRESRLALISAVVVTWGDILVLEMATGPSVPWGVPVASYS